MVAATLRVHQIVEDIIEVIESDKHIQHCRVNIVNGCGDVFMKYKQNLSEISDKEHISVRFYADVDELHDDLFHEEDFMSDDWFNLFVFNVNYCKHLCINEDCINYNMITMQCDEPTYCLEAVCLGEESTSVHNQLMKDIRGIDLISHELIDKFDSKFYATTIVSMMDPQIIHQSFEYVTGEDCPIKSLRHLDFDFDGEEILTYMYKILKTHSTEFLTKWSNTLEKLEVFSKSSSILQGEGEA